jgi:hypothetical protein
MPEHITTNVPRREKHTHPEALMVRASDQAFNQSGELSDYNLFSTHSALVAACAREGATAQHAALIARCYAPQSP